MVGIAVSVEIDFEQQIRYCVQCGFQMPARLEDFDFLPLLLGNVSDHCNEIVNLSIALADAFDIEVDQDDRAVLANVTLIYRVTLGVAPNDFVMLSNTLRNVVGMRYFDPALPFELFT